MKKSSILLIIILAFMMFFLGTKNIMAADVKAFTCTYEKEGDRIIYEYIPKTKKMFLYKGGYTSDKRIDANHSGNKFFTNFPKVTNNTMNCNEYSLYFYVTISGQNVFGFAESSYDNFDLNFLQTNEIIEYKPAVDENVSNEGQVFITPGKCEYVDSTNKRTITISLESNGDIKALMDGEDKYWLEDSGGGTYRQRLLDGDCYKYAVAEHDGYSRIHLVDDLSVKEITEIDVNKIDITGELKDTTWKQTADEQKQEVENLESELNPLILELESLEKQYNDNNCVEDKENETCKTLSESISEKLKLIEPKVKLLEDNPYSTSISRVKQLLERYKGTISSLSKFGFTQYSGEDLNCTSIQRFSEILKDLLKLIRIIGIVLFLALGAVDFAQAIISGEQDLLKKASGKFTKRAIAVVILFFLPIVLEFILKLAGISSNPLCGIGL